MTIKVYCSNMGGKQAPKTKNAVKLIDNITFQVTTLSKQLGMPRALHVANVCNALNREIRWPLGCFYRAVKAQQLHAVPNPAMSFG